MLLFSRVFPVIPLYAVKEGNISKLWTRIGASLIVLGQSRG
jgi:hypothetical protein